MNEILNSAIPLWVILSLIGLHLIGDFFLQTDRMAINKSKSNKMLWIHVAVYSSVFLVFGVKYAIINALLHFITDFVSSRATSYLHAKGQRHWFFVVIGIDQTVHMICLFTTYIMVIA